MKNIERIEFANFWQMLGDQAFLRQSNLTRYTDLVGFHIYADLRLNLDVAAAEDEASAGKCVDLLEDFTSIADQCAKLVQANVLEVQGDRIHLVLQSQDQYSDLGKVLLFASALTRAVYAELKPSAGTDWQGFSMAADFGPAVLVPSGYGGGSVVSLGNAANQPPKKLARGVASGHLALPKSIGGILPGAKPSGDWVELDVNNPVVATREFFDEALTADMRRIARVVLESRRTHQQRSFASVLNERSVLSNAPVRTRGMCQRADLDGFTKTVEQAFKSGKVPELVAKFTEIMDYPIEFAQKIGRQVIEIPWAGDCATMLILPAYLESLDEMRAILPVEAGICWHGLARANGDSARWARSMGSAKWALGLASGNREEGGDGRAIIAEFSAAGRSFRVMVGWCARRAKDAQETSGVSADDVVIPNVDYRNLESSLQPLFKPMGTEYRFSDYARLKQGQSITKPLGNTKPQSALGIEASLPIPKPYWCGND